MDQLSHPYITTGKTIALIIQTFARKVMSLLFIFYFCLCFLFFWGGRGVSLLFNMLFMFVRTFLQRSKHLLISWLQSLSAVIAETKKIKSVTISTFSPSICHEVMGPDAMILVFWMLSFKPVFHSLLSSSSRGSLVCLHFLYSGCIICNLDLRLLIFLPAILIPAWDLPSPAFCIMYFAYKLSKQGDNIQPWCTPFPTLNQSDVPRLVLTVASWPAYRFLRMQGRCLVFLSP